jgi:hypothetical protein
MEKGYAYSRLTAKLHAKNLIVVASWALLMASALDATVHLIGLGWFLGSLSPYTIAVDLLIVTGILAGMVSLFTSNVRRLHRPLIVVLVLSLVACAVLPQTGHVDLPWSSVILISIYLVRTAAIHTREQSAS